MSAWTKIKKKLKSGTWYPFYNTFYEKTRIDPHLILLESRSGRGMESNIFAILRELNREEYRTIPLLWPAAATTEILWKKSCSTMD